jgi:hypothetical protein
MMVALVNSSTTTPYRPTDFMALELAAQVFLVLAHKCSKESTVQKHFMLI